jgi:hypothetical protein
MKSILKLLMLAVLGATAVSAQMNQPMVEENTTKISDHVWAIMGFPNIAIVVGSRGTLVVDTGLGPKNGATAARVGQGSRPTMRSSSSLPRTSIPNTLPVSPVFLPAPF